MKEVTWRILRMNIGSFAGDPLAVVSHPVAAAPNLPETISNPHVTISNPPVAISDPPVAIFLFTCNHF